MTAATTPGTPAAARPVARPVAVMQRVQQLQQLGHPASAVSRPCRQVPSSLAGGPAPVDRAHVLARISELAYGYRTTPRGLARRAPSAGAMYPIELVWITQDGGDWVFRHFDPDRQGCADLGPAGESARSLGLADGEHAALLVGVAWRTIQRYGMRGYRYCLIDAGTVLGNLAAVAVASRTDVRLPSRVEHDLVHGELGVTRDELLLGVAVFGADLAAPTPPPDPPVLGPATLLAERPPMFTPVLERVRRLHRISAPGTQPDLDFAALLADRSVEDAVRSLLGRRSARAFTGAELGPDLLAGLAGLHHHLAEATPSPLREEFELRLVARSGGRWTSRWYDQDVRSWVEHEVPEPPAGALAALFGDQPIAGDATAFSVLGMRGDAERRDPAVYRQLLLAAGVACAGLYEFATRTGCATTTLGGFDDRGVAELAAGDFSVLVVQAFGPGGAPAGGTAPVDKKNDTVAATWLRHSDSSEET